MKLSICIPASQGLGEENSPHEVSASQLLNGTYSKREAIFFDEVVCGYIVMTESDGETNNDDINEEVVSDLNKNTNNSHQFDLFLEIGIIPQDVLENDLNYSIKSFLILSQQITEVVLDDILDNVPYKVYKFLVPISYPRRRLNHPKVIFNAYIQNQMVVEGQSLEASMEDYQPLNERNLLQELHISDDHYHLSSKLHEEENSKEPTIGPDSRELNKVSTKNNITVAYSSSFTLPIYSALVIKLKSTKAAGKNNELLTCFNIESSDQLTKLFTNPTSMIVSIIGFDIEFNGKVIDMNQDVFKSDLKSLHIQFRVGESLSLNYKLINNESDDQLKQANVHLQLMIFEQEGKNYSNFIKTLWSPFIDFNLTAPPINNSLKSTAMQSAVSLKKKIGNSHLNLKKYGSSSFNTSIPMSYKKLASSSSVTVNLNGNNHSANLYGLKLTFNGKFNIKLGEVSNWTLQAINESPNTLNVSVILQNQSQRHLPSQYQHNQQQHHTYSQMHLQSQNLLSSQPQFPNPGLQMSAGTVSKPSLTVDNRFQLYSTYKGLKLDNQGVIILNNDLRLGPLGPNCVFETEIKIIGISKGVYNLDGLHIFDLETGDGLDFGKLVEVFVT